MQAETQKAMTWFEGQYMTLLDRIESLRATADAPYTDEEGKTWLVPTAHAYATACKAYARVANELEALKKQQAQFSVRPVA